MKEFVRKLNKQSSLQTVIVLVAANVLLGLLWFSELYVAQSDTSRLNLELVADQIREINNFDTRICIDSSALADDAAIHKSFDGQLGLESFGKCTENCKVCVVFDAKAEVRTET